MIYDVEFRRVQMYHTWVTTAQIKCGGYLGHAFNVPTDDAIWRAPHGFDKRLLTHVQLVDNGLIQANMQLALGGLTWIGYFFYFESVCYWERKGAERSFDAHHML